MKKNLRSYIVLTITIMVFLFTVMHYRYSIYNKEDCNVEYGCITNDSKIIKDNFSIKDNKIILKGFYNKSIFKSGVANNYFALLHINSAYFSISEDSNKVGNNQEIVFNVTPQSKDIFNKLNEYNIKYDCFDGENIIKVDEVFNITYEQNFYLYYLYHNSLNHFCNNLEDQSNCGVEFSAYLKQ